MSDTLGIATLVIHNGDTRLTKHRVAVGWVASARLGTITDPIPMHPPLADDPPTLLYVHGNGHPALEELYRIFRSIIVADQEGSAILADLLIDEFVAWVQTHTTVTDVDASAVAEVIDDREQPRDYKNRYPAVTGVQYAWVFTINHQI